RQTQYVGKDLEIGKPINSDKWSETAEGVARESVSSCPREAMGRAAEIVAPSSSLRTDGGFPVAQVNDLSRSLTAFDPISTLVVVVEMSKASWLVNGVVPGVERQPLKKLEPDATALLRLIERWRNEAVRAGRPISRIALAYEAGRDGFWLARWLIARDRGACHPFGKRCGAT